MSHHATNGLLLRVIIIFAFSLGLIPNSQAQDTVLGKPKSQWLDILQDSKAPPKSRQAAVIALGIIGPQLEEVDRALAKALRDDPSEIVREQVLNVLGGMKKADLTKWASRVADVLKNEKKAIIRSKAAHVLGKLEDLAMPVLSNLITACKDTDVATRAAAIEAIGKIGYEAGDAGPQLMPHLKDKEWNVRLNTVFALGRIGSTASNTVPELIQLYSTEKEKEVRKEILKVFAQLGEGRRDAINVLVKVLKEDPSVELRQQAALSLGKMGTEVRSDLDTLREVLKKDRDPTVRIYLVNTIPVILGDNSAVIIKDFLDRLKLETETDLKLAIIEQLGSMREKGKEAIPGLRTVQDDVSVAVRDAAKAAIRKIEGVQKK